MTTNKTDYPAARGFSFPPEWSEQEGVLLSAPLNPDTWTPNRMEMELEYATFAAAISHFEKVFLNCVRSEQSDWMEHLIDAKAFPENIVFFDIPTNDAWCRDHGPLFLKHPSGKRACADFKYNAWGGKFPPWDLDNSVPERIAELFQIERFEIPITCEGGALETNGNGTLLTTKSVILDPERNPGLTMEQTEKILCNSLGMNQIFWLPAGMPADDTGGHIDTLARFVSHNTICAPLPGKTDDFPGSEQLRINFNILKKMRFLDGSAPEIVPLPVPAPVRPKNWREEILPATYANFLITNNAVLVPVYGEKNSDDRACTVLEQLFPSRRIVPLSCRAILLEGGALHCLSQQVPR